MAAVAAGTLAAGTLAAGTSGRRDQWPQGQVNPDYPVEAVEFLLKVLEPVS